MHPRGHPLVAEFKKSDGVFSQTVKVKLYSVTLEKCNYLSLCFIYELWMNAELGKCFFYTSSKMFKTFNYHSLEIFKGFIISGLELF